MDELDVVLALAFVDLTPATVARELALIDGTTLVIVDQGGVASTQPGVALPTAIAGGDFDGDGNGDVVVGTETDDFHVFPGDGTGFLADSIVHAGELGELTVGDFDGDGRSDILATDHDHALQIRYGDAIDTPILLFGSARDPVAGRMQPFMNYDALFTDGDVVHLWVGTAEHSLQVFPLGASSFVAPAAGDVNLDGLDEIVDAWTSYVIAWTVNGPDDAARPSTDVEDTAVADVVDAVPRIAIAGANGLAVIHGLECQAVVPDSAPADLVAAGDLDGNGTDEIAFVSDYVLRIVDFE
jgi:hypothetical protein